MREALGSGLADELLLVGEFVEGESRAGFQGIGQFRLVKNRQRKEEASIPRRENDWENPRDRGQVAAGPMIGLSTLKSSA